MEGVGHSADEGCLARNATYQVGRQVLLTMLQLLGSLPYGTMCADCTISVPSTILHVLEDDEVREVQEAQWDGRSIQC
jgi:hypothetical protein